MPESIFHFVDRNLNDLLILFAKSFIFIFLLSINALYKPNIFGWGLLVLMILVGIVTFFFLFDWFREGKEDDLISDETIHDAAVLFCVAAGVFSLFYIPIAIAILQANASGALDVGIMRWVYIVIGGAVVWKLDDFLTDRVKNRWAAKLPN